MIGVIEFLNYNLNRKLMDCRLHEDRDFILSTAIFQALEQYLVLTRSSINI